MLVHAVSGFGLRCCFALINRRNGNEQVTVFGLATAVELVMVILL